MIGVISDYCIALLSYYLALQYVPELYALAAAVLYSITPASYLQSISESARPLGALWYTLSIVLLSSNGIIETMLATITITLTLISHKMATQTLFLTCLLISPLLYAANNFFPLILLLGLALALLLTKGSYARILKDHAGYVGFHLKYGSWNKGKKEPGSPLTLAKFQPYFYIPIIGLLFYPHMFVGLTLEILAWYASILVLFFVWLWGDNYRYLTYSAVPAAILSMYATYIGMNPLAIIPALIVSALVIGKNILTSNRQPILPDFIKIDVPEESVILVLPSSVIYVSARHLKGRVLFGGGNAEALVFELETLPKIMSTNPNELLEKYPLTHILLGPERQDFIKPIEKNFEKVLETNGYVLFKRKAP
jgi:hypothetical protein